MEFLLIVIGFAFVASLVAGFVLSIAAKNQIDTHAKAPRTRVTDTIIDHFGSVWWRSVDGPGDFNFQARGFGLNSAGLRRPVVSIDVAALDNGNTTVAAWMSAWSQRMGIVGCCDRVYFKRRQLIKKIEAL
ncbi:hypothetical protein SAMN04244553_3627 [Nocardia amikacinitolerans]|uniref:Uncharacterized protein n=1 Tax=Nocardia amikacinitolerans TaxID=756689 RepID=A0A285LHG4_9NOCA|nr:hypothetical protein [Nocardia amikacinitolerans]MCP2278422.1 hypothetical protein [Nocardia amikacinitolerans]SNY84398.1 hypothetical protein SAMN04244553_3627 [Nocardia amikacinitolerans]